MSINQAKFILERENSCRFCTGLLTYPESCSSQEVEGGRQD